MLIRVSYLLLLAAIAIAVFIVVQLNRDDANETSLYTGAHRCAVCHTSASAGRQVAAWRQSAHDDAYTALVSDSAQRYIRANGASIESCLRCHTTIGRNALSDHELPLVAEGVGCERCHGPGSRYSYYNVMRDRAAFAANGGVVGSLEDCYQCHAADPTTDSTRCPFQLAAFNADTAWLAIRHPVNDRAPKPDTVQELRP
jgi:hypothetical protein